LTSSPFFFKGKQTKFNVCSRRRAGVSPLIATTIILAITITMGMALYSFVNSQSNVATQSFAQEATDYINFRNDRFVITNISFKTDLCGNFPNGTKVPNCVSAYLFNSGEVPITVNQVLFGTSSTSMQQYCIDIPDTKNNNKERSFASNVVSLPPKKMLSVSFHTRACFGSGEFPLPSQDQVYYMKIATQNGSYQSAFQKYKVS
jgi:hypothetical protein